MKKIIIAAVAAVLLCGCGQVDIKSKRTDNNNTNDSENNPLFTTTTTSETLYPNFFPQVDEEEEYIATTTQPDIVVIDDQNIATVKTKKTKRTEEPVITMQPATVTTRQTTTTTTRPTTTTTTTTTKKTTTTTTTTTTAATTTAPDDEKQKKYDDAQSRANSAKKAAADAEAAITEAETAYQEAAKLLAQEQALLDTIKAAFPYSSDALGFFNYVQAVDAISAINNAEYASMTDIGGAGDASSLENIKNSFQYLYKCNELRAAEGLPELKVTDRMMAYAIADVNVSASYQEHARQFEGIAENLKWGEGNPFNSWYNDEKAVGGGHYLNIVDDQMEVTGFAVNNSDKAILSITFCQVYGTAESAGTRYTVAEYEARFNDFYKKCVTADIAGHEKNLTTLKEAYEKAKEALEKAKLAKEVADKEATDAADAYEKLEKENPKHTGSGHKEIKL